MKKILLILTSIIFATTAWSAPFGDKADVDYANALWQALHQANFLGDSGIMSRPYKGMAPHGAVLDTIEGTVTVNGDTGVFIVKRNYGAPNLTIDMVADHPEKYLKAITVMFKRAGYDADNKDWFWAKYLADGSLDKNAKGMALAGKVAKGMPAGCIACHQNAPGGDMVFIHNRLSDM